ncbi:MAG TPA: hypothetical protein VF039_12230 [Longimicrobiales bacterium]
MRLDRREFLGVSVGALVALRLPARHEPVRIALLAPGGPADSSALAASLDGARLGAEELARTFALLGREIALVEGVAGDATGVVSLMQDDSAPTLPLVVDARAHSSCTASAAFRIGTTRPDAMLWHPSLFRYGAQQLNDRFRRRYGRGMDEHAWAGWFSLKVLGEAALRARSNDPARLAAWMLSPRARFDGHKGVPLHFDARRVLVQPTFTMSAGEIQQIEPAGSCAP